VSVNKPSSNFGTDTKLKAQSGIQRSYLTFDVGTITGTVVSATLKVTAGSASSTGFEVRGVADTSWGEQSITWNNSPAPAATVTRSSGAIKLNQAVSLDVTPLVTSGGLVSMALTTPSSTTVWVDSREASASVAPQLVVVTESDVQPANVSPPSISGLTQDGEILTADPGTWTGTDPIRYAYQWRRCDEAGQSCGDIAGATAQTYAATGADVGSTLEVRVTASNHLSASATSAPTQTVAPAPPVNRSAPLVTGAAQVGQTLSATTGSWSGTQPISYSYQWLRCDPLGEACAPIPGATADTYAPVSGSPFQGGDAGATLRVAVTASNAAGAAVATSAATEAVTDPPVNASPPSITGTAQQGQTLTADPGEWSSSSQPVDYAYQWRRCDTGGGSCADIAGQTRATYDLVSADVGATIRVAVTASSSAGASTAASAQTAVVTGPPANGSPPTIAGTATQGQVLAADPGVWSGTQPLTFTYQWRRCDPSGGSCTDIAGATAKTYTLAAADAGAQIRVAVTGVNSVGSSTATSASTATVSASAPPASAAAPTISGSVQQGQTVTADPGTWSGTQPIRYAYQWRRCDGAGAGCVTISAAVGQSYTPSSTDVGSTLRVAVTASNSVGTTTATSTFTTAVTASGSVGFRDQSLSGAGTAPTGSKPESKLWFNDGAWWAIMWAGSGKGFHIFKLDTATQRWSDTGVAIDDRSGTRADTLWDGTHLYVASHRFATCGCSTSSVGPPSRLYRYSYANGSYSLDTGFPVQLNNTQSETLVIDEDSTGMLWATWAQDGRVMVTHSRAGNDASWVAPYVLPATGASTLDSDDITSLVAFGTNASGGKRIGVLWSNQNESVVYFAYHGDGNGDSSWTVKEAMRSPLIADDHLNLKSLSSDGSGRVFAVTKTSLNDAASPDANAPIVLLLAFTPASGWSNYPVWRVSDGVTRPILLIDESNLVLHVFATSSESGGTIREKTSPISSISFPSGSGTTFLKDAANNALNNATSTKQNLTRATGLVLLAGNDSTGYYWHGYESLP